MRLFFLVATAMLLIPRLAAADCPPGADCPTPTPTAPTPKTTTPQRQTPTGGSPRWSILGYALDQMRFGADMVTFSGTRLNGVGSREHYRGGGFDIELCGSRFFSKRWGIELDLIGLPTRDANGSGRGPEDPPESFFRGELGLDLAAAAWNGKVPGALLLGVGGGVDVGRYWYSPRGYPYALSRLRLWPTRDVSVQVQYELIPISPGAPILTTFEQRVELATSITLFQFGLQLSYADATGGTPSRNYFQASMGTFVGLVIM